MTRWRFLIPACLLWLSCAPHGPRPNVLLVTIDTLRADRLGCYGYARDTTPHIDRLAAQGALFENAYTPLPRTTQSVASILTGRYPKSHGARGLFSSLSPANETLAEVLQARGYATAAFTSNNFLRAGKGFDQGFDVYDNPPGGWVEDSASSVSGRALAWLRGRPAGRPFLLWVHYLDPHWTYRPVAPFDRVFDPGFEGPFPLYDDLDAHRLTKGDVIFRNRLTPREVDHVKALYDGEIAQVDAALAPLLEFAARPEMQPLLIVLTSDHGESLGENGYYFAHGEYLYEPTLRVPLIVSFAGRIAAGSRLPQLVENVDIAPTILSLAGVPGMQSVDGHPLFVEGRAAGPAAPAPWAAAPGRRVVLAESDFQLIHPENRRYYIPGPGGRWASACDGRFKLIRIPRPGGDIQEFYDLKSDPGESRSLEGAGADAETRARLLGEIQRYTDYDAGAPGGAREIDEEERERLRSLGYIN